jgi:hypothetical protein
VLLFDLLTQAECLAAGTAPGYVVDHVRALECGGPDDPSKMQWQTTADAKVKDKTERQCRI